MNIKSKITLQKIDSYIHTKKGIFLILLISKILLIPFILYFASKLDPRPFNILILPDLNRYEDLSRLTNYFVTDKWTPSIGFMGLATLIRVISNLEVTKYIIYGFISLFIMTLSQTILLYNLFKYKINSSVYIKVASLILSIINFYILIYSVKPSTDVFGCLGIVILFSGLLKYNNNDKKDNNITYRGSNSWLIMLLIISLFRSNLFIVIPFISLTYSFKNIIKDINSLRNYKKFLSILSLTTLAILNLYQLSSYIVLYQFDQTSGGLIGTLINNQPGNLLNQIINMIIILFKKFIYLISARETIAINNYDFFIFEKTNLFNYPLIFNIITTGYLLINNMIGFISINTSFGVKIRNNFLFTMIPLIPLVSYFTHHRYFLAYCLFTSASLPFIFEKKS